MQRMVGSEYSFDSNVSSGSLCLLMSTYLVNHILLLGYEHLARNKCPRTLLHSAHNPLTNVYDDYTASNSHDLRSNYIHGPWVGTEGGGPSSVVNSSDPKLLVYPSQSSSTSFAPASSQTQLPHFSFASRALTRCSHPSPFPVLLFSSTHSTNQAVRSYPASHFWSLPGFDFFQCFAPNPAFMRR